MFTIDSKMAQQVELYFYKLLQKKILAYLANVCTHPNRCHRGIIKKLALMVVNTSIIVCTCPTAS